MSRQSFPIVLDVVAPRNRDVLFYPAGRNLSGEARATEAVGNNINGALSRLGTIPGHRILVDMEGRVVKIVHRMTLPENKDKDRQLRELAERNPKYRHCRFGSYEDDQEFKVAPSEWPTWLWHIRCLVNHKRLRIEKGANLIPTPDDIYAMASKTGYWPVLGDRGSASYQDPTRPFDKLGPHNAADFGITVPAETVSTP